jgi:hypothetical protein
VNVNDLPKKIAGFIEDGASGSFLALALELFEYQYTHNLPYRRLCQTTGITPESIVDWEDIPAVPAQAFRLFDLSCRPVSECPTVFYSSGTTSDRASRHWMDAEALSLYHTSLRFNFDSQFPNVERLWAVMPNSIESPHSSLSNMLAALSAEQFAGADLTVFSAQLTEAARQSIPITLFGTAFGLMELLSLSKIMLPQGSKVIETGGFKGRFQEIERPDFYDQLGSGFRVGDLECYAEYGMCELASQFYSRGVNGYLHGPHWIKTRCIDPITNQDCLPGRPGLLRHYDLANLNSVIAIQTQDRAIAVADGSFRLLGRASDADLRGCSLTAEELWST